MAVRAPTACKLPIEAAAPAADEGCAAKPLALLTPELLLFEPATLRPATKNLR